MSYYRFESHFVYENESRFGNIKQAYLETLSAEERIGFNVLYGDKSRSQHRTNYDQLVRSIVQSDFKHLPLKEFIKKWVTIDFSNDEAYNESWDVISDCLQINQLGFIKDCSNYNGLYNRNPKPEVIQLNLYLAKHTNGFINRLFRREDERMFSTYIDLRNVTRIKGTLESIVILLNQIDIRLSNNCVLVTNN